MSRDIVNLDKLAAAQEAADAADDSVTTGPPSVTVGLAWEHQAWRKRYSKSARQFFKAHEPGAVRGGKPLAIRLIED